MTPTEIADKFAHLQTAVDRAYGRYEAQVEAVDQLRQEIGRLEREESLLTLSGTALQTLLNLIAMESLVEIEQLVTYGLQSVFDDQSLTFRLQVETKRGGQTVTPRLVQGRVEAEILDAFGGGPATVAAFLLRLLVVRRLGLAPVILLDEAFSMVSEQYVPRVAALLRELAERLQFTILLVTHQPAFLPYAHRAYEAVGRPAKDGVPETVFVEKVR